MGLSGSPASSPPTLIAPFAGLPTVRWRPEAVLRTANAIRTAGDRPARSSSSGWTCRSSSCSSWSPSRPASERSAAAPHGPPAGARRGRRAQLVAANVTSSAAEGLGTFVGPALAGLLLVAERPAGRHPGRPRHLRRRRRGDRPLHVPGRRAVRHVGAGRARPALGRGRRAGRAARAAAHRPRARDCRPSSAGLLTVLVVVAAIELLGMGEPGVGALNAALGLGGLARSGGRRSRSPVASASPRHSASRSPAGAPRSRSSGSSSHPSVGRCGAMIVVGVSNALHRCRGLHARPADDAECRAGSPCSGSSTASPTGASRSAAIVAPFLIEALGIRGALDRRAALDPADRRASCRARPCAGWTRAASAGVRRVELIRGDPLFAPLSLATVEHLAAASARSPSRTARGSCARASPACDYVLIDTGTAEVRRTAGSSGRSGRAAASGRSRSCATCRGRRRVRAVGPVTAFSLDRAAFLEAVTGHARVGPSPTSRVEEHLAADTERPALH